MNSKKDVDPLKNGAIFRIRNFSVIRSPSYQQKLKSNENSPHNSMILQIANEYSNSEVVSHHGQEQVQQEKEMFNQIYRATPAPVVIMDDQNSHQNSPYNNNNNNNNNNNSPYNITYPNSSINSSNQNYININAKRKYQNYDDDHDHDHDNNNMHVYDNNNQYIKKNSSNIKNKSTNNNNNNNHHNNQKLSNGKNIQRYYNSDNIESFNSNNNSHSHNISSNNDLNNGNDDSNDDVYYPSSPIIINKTRASPQKSNHSSPSLNIKKSINSPILNQNNSLLSPSNKTSTIVQEKLSESPKPLSAVINHVLQPAIARVGRGAQMKAMMTDSLLNLGSTIKSPDLLLSNAINNNNNKINLQSRKTPTNKTSKTNNKEIEFENSKEKNIIRKIEKPKQINSKYIDDDNDKDDEIDKKTKITRSGRVSLPVSRAADLPLAHHSPGTLKRMNKEIGVGDLYKGSRIITDDQEWTDKELSYLYHVHSCIDPTDPKFWLSISKELCNHGIKKSVTQCQDQWYKEFQSSKVSKQNKTITNNNQNNKKKRFGKAEIQRMAEIAVKSGKEDDIFDNLQVSPNNYLRKNEIDDIRSPESIDDYQTSKIINADRPQWKAVYVHNLSKKIKTSTIRIENEEKKIPITKNKKCVDGRITGLLSPTSGKVKIIVQKNDSDDSEEEINDEDED